MARFMVKASEYKNVCKAVNDRKLAELKKEIIEILKKQDEKEVKKAVDYFNSQELHYTHLEKSLSGKWIEKAGYGIGTVRVWKGKKYKKIAPNKWVRVFDKEGRGTNIAIGKLIAKVQKIDNVEDLMSFVMANKQRFVDENGVDLPVLDKLRAAVDAKNNGGIGSKETSKPAENTESAISDLMTVDWSETDGKDVYKIIDGYFKTDAEKKKFLKDIGGDTRINKFQKELISDVIEENNKPAEKKNDDSKAYEGKLATQKQVDEATAISNKYEVSRNEMLKKPITTIQKYANSIVEDFEGGIDKFIEYMAERSSEGVSMDEVGKEFAKLINHNVARKIWDDYESGALVPDEKGILKPKEESEAEKKEDLEAALKEVEDAIDNAGDYDDIEELENERQKLLKEIGDKGEKKTGKTEKVELGTFTKIDDKTVEMPSEKKKSFKQEMDQLYDAQDEAWEGFESGSEIKSSPENSKKFYEKVKKFVDNNNIRLSKKHYEEIADRNGHSFNEALALAGAYGEENKKRALAKNRENAEKYKGAVLDLSMIDEFKTAESEEEKHQNRSDAMKGYKDGLDKDLIRNANGSSNMYEPGDAIEREFKGGLKAIDMWNLSDEEKEKAKQKFFELSTEELKAQSGAISVTASGPARSVKGADKKFEKVQKIRGEKQTLLNELREKSRKADNQEETKKIVSSAADAIKENKLSFISEGKLYYRGNTKSNSWTVIDKIPELKDDDSIETKKNQLKELNAKSKNLGFADPEKAKVLENINRLKNEIAYMNTDNYKLSKEGVEKSLFDDFVMDMFIDDELEDEEELEEGETEYNDYSAEQPGLFNSTEFAVREALNRRFNCL